MFQVQSPFGFTHNDYTVFIFQMYVSKTLAEYEQKRRFVTFRSAGMRIKLKITDWLSTTLCCETLELLL